MRIQAIITELVFEHALRVRMKAETSDTVPSSSISTAAATPDNASQVGTDGSQGDNDNDGSAAYSPAASSSTAGPLGTPNSAKGKGKGSSEPEAGKEPGSVNADDTKKDGNKHLIGRINNLVSSDLANFENVGICVVFVRKSSHAAKQREALLNAAQ